MDHRGGPPDRAVPPAGPGHECAFRPQDPKAETDAGETAGEEERRSKAGLEVPTFGGPESVGQVLEDQDEIKEYHFTVLQRALEPWVLDSVRNPEKSSVLILGLRARWEI